MVYLNNKLFIYFFCILTIGKRRMARKLPPKRFKIKYKVGRPAREWTVTLHRTNIKTYNKKKYITYSGDLSRQDTIRAARSLKKRYKSWDIFANPNSRTIVFRK
jgi:hypothetical protein